uniref:Uncharacterized protein n=1 Tax=Rhodnius prolixus TaxID=13249 RepID=T1IC39_RHOPR
MDKITSSDRFKQLRLNIVGSKYSNNLKSLSNSESRSKKPTRMKLIKESERISGSKCTLRNKTLSEKPSQSNRGEPAIGSDRRQASICHRDDSKNYKNVEKINKLVGKNERDSSGFLKPVNPAPRRIVLEPFTNEHLQSTKDQSSFLKRVNAESNRTTHEPFVIEQLNIFNDLKQRIIDTNLFDEAIPQNVATKDRIQSWLHSLQDTSKLPESRAETLENSSRILSVLPESTLNNEGEKKNPAFMLKDWTVIKGSSETELFVSGVLIDMRSRKVLEQKHRSSNVIEKSGDNFVKTVCCIYQLCGDFIEGNDMPQVIKKYFENGKFPDDWKTIAIKWHSLNSALFKNVTGTSNRNISKRILEAIQSKSPPGCGNDVPKGNIEKIRNATTRATLNSETPIQLISLTNYSQLREVSYDGMGSKLEVSWISKKDVETKVTGRSREGRRVTWKDNL